MAVPSRDLVIDITREPRVGPRASTRREPLRGASGPRRQEGERQGQPATGVRRMGSRRTVGPTRRLAVFGIGRSR